ncbi:hypothetical protein B5M42_020105 [Paenibacillus athensensis]|uniref:DUF7847 domain-containing protein n=1 Tax=Paenibacillus athensensis TaxID=1967502 RepID=A0A4Y8Q2I0_9BACL|nr:hypothetical protein [Paenibacillus athensensis]MCD1261112.1 hypothetical protein [Paenibacillus athensensis]
MINGQLRPLSAGRLLDRSFRLYRKHWVKLMLLALVLYGPFYVLLNLLFRGTGSAELLPWSDWLSDSDAVEDTLSLGGMAAMNDGIDPWRVLVLLLVLIPLFLNVGMPLFVAGILHLVKADLLQEGERSLGQMLKAGLGRFWPMLGNTLLVQMAGAGVYMVLSVFLLIVGGLVTISAGSMLLMGFSGSGSVMGVLLIVLIVGVSLACACAALYFIFRFMYFLPGVALGEVSVGLGQSWRLTRRSFWRLLVMYIVQTAVVYPLTLVLVLLLSLLGNWTGSSTVVQLLETVASLVMAPMWALPYVVSYFDLKVRNEGLGLRELMEAAGIPAEAAAVNSPRNADNGSGPAFYSARGPASEVAAAGSEPNGLSEGTTSTATVAVSEPASGEAAGGEPVQANADRAEPNPAPIVDLRKQRDGDE